MDADLEVRPPKQRRSREAWNRVLDAGVAILEDDQLVELLVDRPDARRMVGDIYVGRVEAVLPGIQAAFVDIGTEKSAFLHASWNAWVKSRRDANAAVAALVIGAGFPNL